MEQKENLFQPPEYTAAMFSEFFEEAKKRAIRANEIEEILDEDYDLDRLKELVGLVKNIPHVCKFCVGCEMEPKDGHGCDEYDSFVFSTRRLQELAEADREGRCVVLPCKVGKTVYMPFCNEVVEKRIGQFHINGYTSPRIWADIDCDWATTQRVRWDLAFGKTVFLSHEAAEAALKGEQDG